MAAEHMLILTGVGTIGVVVSTAIVKFFASRKGNGTNVTKTRPFSLCKCLRNRVRDDLVSNPEPACVTPSNGSGSQQAHSSTSDHSSTTSPSDFYQEQDVPEKIYSDRIQYTLTPVSNPRTSRKQVSFSLPLPTTSVDSGALGSSEGLLQSCPSPHTSPECSDKKCVPNEASSGKWEESVDEVDEVLIDMDVTPVSIAVPNMKRSYERTFNSICCEAMTEAVADLIFSDAWNHKNDSEQCDKMETLPENETHQTDQADGQMKRHIQDNKDLPPAVPNPQISQQRSSTSLQENLIADESRSQHNPRPTPPTHFATVADKKQEMSQPGAKLVNKLDKANESCQPDGANSGQEDMNGNEDGETAEKGNATTSKSPQVNEVCNSMKNQAMVANLEDRSEKPATRGDTDLSEPPPDKEVSSPVRDAKVKKEQEETLTESSKFSKGNENCHDEISPKLAESEVVFQNTNKENRITLHSDKGGLERKRRTINESAQALVTGSSQKYLALIKPVLLRRGSFGEERKPRPTRLKKLFAPQKKTASTQAPFQNTVTTSKTNSALLSTYNGSSAAVPTKVTTKTDGTKHETGDTRQVRVVEVPVKAMPPQRQKKTASSNKNNSAIVDNNGSGNDDKLSFFRRGRRGGLPILRRRRGTLQNNPNPEQMTGTDGEVGFRRKITQRFRDRLRTLASKV